MISRRIPELSQPNAWSAALERRRRSGQPLVDLTEQNPTRVGLGGADADALAALADPRGSRYEPDPRGLAPARQAIAGYYASRGLSVDAGDLVLASGTSEAYAHLFRLLCDPGERVLVPAPSYPLFEPLASLEGVVVDTFPLRFEGRWRPDLDALERAVDPRTRAVIVVQPNHPTGSRLAGEEIAALDRICARRGIALLSDEVFGDFLWDATEPGPEPSLIGEREAPTFVLHGLSKLCGAPQLKLSWVALAGPEPGRSEARRALEWIADAFLSVGTPVQLALPRLLDRRHAYRRRVLDRVRANRQRLDRALASSGAEALPAEGGWTAVIRLPDGRGAEACALELIDRGVVVHPGHFYDFADDRHLVVSLIVPPEDLAAGAGAVGEAAGR